MGQINSSETDCEQLVYLRAEVDRCFGWGLVAFQEFGDFLLNLEGILVIAEGLGEPGVDLLALWGLVDDVPEGVNALN